MQQQLQNNTGMRKSSDDVNIFINGVKISIESGTTLLRNVVHKKKGEEVYKMRDLSNAHLFPV